MKIFIRSSSKGLAEIAQNDTLGVQFIHESVQDFLVGHLDQWSGFSGSLAGRGHEVLKNCCFSQINAPIDLGLNSIALLLNCRTRGFPAVFVSPGFPFLDYAVDEYLYRVDRVHQNAIDQREFLNDFPFQRWIFLHNALAKNNFDRYKKSASLLYILAERNLTNLIRIYPQRESCFNNKTERFGPPILAALATRSLDAVHELLEMEAKVQPPASLLHHSIIYARNTVDIQAE